MRPHYSDIPTSRFIEMFGDPINYKHKTFRLGDLCRVINGRAYKAKELLDNGKYLVLRVGNFFSNDSWYYSDLELEEDKYCDKGDLLYAWSCTLGPRIWDGEKTIFHYHIWNIKDFEPALNKVFFLKLLEQQTEYLQSQTHGSTMAHITKGLFEDLNIPVPPMLLQEQFVSIAEQADKSEFDGFKSRFIEMFGDPVSNPKGWPTDDLLNLGYLNRGVSKARPRNQEDLYGGDYPFIQTGDISRANRYITAHHQTYSDKGLAQSKLWPKGTLCITIAANIAETAILSYDACFPDSVVGFIPLERIKLIFLQYWFTFLQSVLEKQAPQTAQKNINIAILSKLQVIQPPISLQNQFVAIAEQADKSEYYNLN